MDNLWLGDCLAEMDRIANGSVDMILADVPYGTTACHWDSAIPLEPMWAQFKRVIKPRGAIVMTATQPFTSVLVMSNLEWFKYEWIWEKSKPNGWQHAQNKPMRTTEDVLIFSPGSMGHSSLLSDNRMTYNPQGISPAGKKTIAPVFHGRTMGARPNQIGIVYDAYTGFPSNVLKFANVTGDQAIHPTQKPVALFAYLIRTYTNPGDLVLDPTAGSGTTAIAAIETGREWICIEQDPDYYAIAQKRIEERLAQPFLIDPNPRHNGAKAEQASFSLDVTQR